MSTLSQVGIPGVGQGILPPMVQHQFRVSFVNAAGDNLDISDQLSNEVIRIGPLTTNPMNSFGFACNSCTAMVVQDDIASNALKALLQLQETEEFNIKIEYLDGSNTVLRTVLITKAKIQLLCMGELDYASTADKIVTHLKVADQPLQSLDAPIIGEIGQLLKGATIVTENQQSGRSAAALTIHVDIHYSDLTFSFPS